MTIDCNKNNLLNLTYKLSLVKFMVLNYMNFAFKKS